MLLLQQRIFGKKIELLKGMGASSILVSEIDKAIA